jgi:cytochrome P450
MALKPYTFSDGTYVPAGSIIGVPIMPHQLDSDNYENPNEFDPFRFENAKENEATRKYFTSVDSEYLPFGLGQYRCMAIYRMQRSSD